MEAVASAFCLPVRPNSACGNRARGRDQRTGGGKKRQKQKQSSIYRPHWKCVKRVSRPGGGEEDSARERRGGRRKWCELRCELSGSVVCARAFTSSVVSLGTALRI
jgi:hypothetical protein